MYVYIKDQFVFLICSFCSGIFLSLLYDLFRIVRVSRGNRYSNKLSPEHVISKCRILKLYNRYSVRRSEKIQNKRTEFILVFAEDIIYSAFVILTVQILVFGGNYGIPRLFSFVGIAVGFLLCRISLGKMFMLVSEYISYFAGALIYYILYPFYYLFVKIKKMIYKTNNMIYNRYVKRILKKKSKKKLQDIQFFMLNFAKKY